MMLKLTIFYFTVFVISLCYCGTKKTCHVCLPVNENKLSVTLCCEDEKTAADTDTKKDQKDTKTEANNEFILPQVLDGFSKLTQNFYDVYSIFRSHREEKRKAREERRKELLKLAEDQMSAHVKAEEQSEGPATVKGVTEKLSTAMVDQHFAHTGRAAIPLVQYQQPQPIHQYQPLQQQPQQYYYQQPQPPQIYQQSSYETVYSYPQQVPHYHSLQSRVPVVHQQFVHRPLCRPTFWSRMRHRMTGRGLC